MDFVQLGRSGLKVSPICLGTMMFGSAADEAASLRIIDKARDFGINFIDTADVYNAGVSEEIIGRAIAGDRNRWIVATKVGSPPSGGAGESGLLARSRILRSAQESAKRLQTDRIDIYYLHKEDPSTPLAETIGALAELLRSGLIGSFGVSNYRGWRVAEICRLCDELGIDRPIVSQPYYNALNRMPEVEHLPACSYYGLGVFPYSPIARGVLTGKYLAGETPPADSRAARNDKRILQTEWRPEFARDRPDHQAACAKPRHHRHAICRELGSRQSLGHRCGCGSAHRNPARRLHPCARLSLHAGRRGYLSTSW